MAKLYVKYVPKTGFEEGTQVVLENVMDVGIANDFLVVRYTDGVVTFTKTEYITDAQFDPTEDEPTDNVQGDDNPADQ